MRITILTLFPEMYGDFLKTSIVGRSIARGIVSVDLVQIRDFAHDTYRHVDDTPFGGGAGMVMKCQPVLDAINSVRTPESYTVLMSPSGTPYSQKKAHELSGKSHLILLCGHYEGLDERISRHVDEELSIGDYVLTGGELAAAVICDAVIRILPGVIGDEQSALEDSFQDGLVAPPEYTRPAEFRGWKVPDVLLSGDHSKIAQWRYEQALERTRHRRPELLK